MELESGKNFHLHRKESVSSFMKYFTVLFSQLVTQEIILGLELSNWFAFFVIYLCL